MRPNRFVRLAVALLAPLLVAGVVVAQAGAAFAGTGHHGHVLYVSASAKHWNSDRSCRSAAFKTIQSAVNAAPAGGTGPGVLAHLVGTWLTVDAELGPLMIR